MKCLFACDGPDLAGVPLVHGMSMGGQERPPASDLADVEVMLAEAEHDQSSQCPGVW